MTDKVPRRQQTDQAEQARVRAEVNAATQTQIERYQDMIRNKIRRKMKEGGGRARKCRSDFQGDLVAGRYVDG